MPACVSKDGQEHKPSLWPSFETPSLRSGSSGRGLQMVETPNLAGPIVVTPRAFP